MGDRVWLKLTIHGHIKDSATLDQITSKLQDEGFDYGHWGTSCDSAADFRAEFIAAVGRGDNPSFEMNECNYANIDAVEDALQEHSIAYHVDWASGGEFPAGAKSWTKDRYSEAHGSDQMPAMIEPESVRRALEGALNPLEAIKLILSDIDFANGTRLPQCSVGGDLVPEVAVAIAKRAMDIEDKEQVA